MTQQEKIESWFEEWIARYGINFPRVKSYAKAFAAYCLEQRERDLQNEEPKIAVEAEKYKRKASENGEYIGFMDGVFWVLERLIKS